MYDRTSLHQKTSAHEWRRVRAGPAVGEEGPSQSRQTKGRGTNISQRQRVKLIVRSVRMYEVPPNANCADEQTGEAKVVTTRVVGNLSSTRLKNRNGQNFETELRSSDESNRYAVTMLSKFSHLDAVNRDCRDGLGVGIRAGVLDPVILPASGRMIRGRY